MEGWIKLHRQITEHWIWKDPVKFQWWIDMLLMANHADAKVNIGYELFECKRGQSILSLKSWGERWGVSKDTVRNFFVLLSKDNMIISENLQKSTRITICNYDTYQNDLHAEQTQSKRLTNAKQTQAHPNKNDKNENNDKNIDIREKSKRFIPPTPEEIKIYCSERNNNVDYQKFFDFYQAKGWMVGRNKMKDWKASVRTWEKSENKYPSTNNNQSKFNNRRNLSEKVNHSSEHL